MGLLIWALYKCSEQSIIAQTLFMPHFKEGRVIVDAWLQHPWIVQNRSTEGDCPMSHYLNIWRERECKFPLNVLLTHLSHRQIHGLFTTSRLHVLRNLSFVGVSTLASLVSWAYASQKIAYCQIWLLRAFMCLQAILYFFFNVFNNGTYMVTWSAEMQGTPEMVDFINFGLS